LSFLSTEHCSHCFPSRRFYHIFVRSESNNCHLILSLDGIGLRFEFNICHMAQLLLIPDPRPLVERLGVSFFHHLTERPGVYLMWDAQEKILYVGKAKNLKQRLNCYRVANPDRMARRHLRMLRQVSRIELQECADEIAALAKEAELLRTLKPKFNRAGVWPAKSRFLVWHRKQAKLTFAITEAPGLGWNVFGPFGSSVIYLRAAMMRLLWYALNPATGSVTMPEGWLHGRLGIVSSLSTVPAFESNEVENILIRLFNGDAEGFAAWINDRTQSCANLFDKQIVKSDLETVLEYIKTKAHRNLSLVVSPSDVPADQPEHSEVGCFFVQEDRTIR
jgi:predicted GIY-YIG superfamily endonuclease